jgi:enoyl-CoA hydratase/carnithine racemase
MEWNVFMPAIVYEVRDHVAEIALAHAPVNAMTEEMIDSLLVCLDRAANDPAVRAVILHSTVPKVFCAGLNLEVLRGVHPEKLHSVLDKLYPRLCEAQFRLGKPSIAAMNGSARGGGMTLAISCDMLVCGNSSTFGYPEIDRALLPAIHYTHLHRIVGRYRAFDLLFTGRSFDAQEAMQLGLVSRVVEDADVLEQARTLAQVFASKSPQAVRVGRAAFMNGIDTDYRRGVANAVDLFCTMAVTQDGREGLEAFSAKRAPRWTGT